ncbi:hypothetical protein [Allomuricauda sp. NBRC 101325]|uniref:hypothetical protein n=1 Tax=Allomuricauda sp. NBRC 101325 TaxID=1113758 RepID=UPI0025578F25|nr:hypothetical protein [Muricauda sp. NBRC 101325]
MAFCRDDQFIVRIDELKCGKLRYLCWHKSKSIFNLPCLILRDGVIEKSASGNKLEFVFTNKDSLYVMEYLLPITEDGRPKFFLEITDYRNKKSTWKMEEIPLPRYLLNI